MSLSYPFCFFSFIALIIISNSISSWLFICLISAFLSVQKVPQDRYLTVFFFFPPAIFILPVHPKHLLQCGHSIDSEWLFAEWINKRKFKEKKHKVSETHFLLRALAQKSLSCLSCLFSGQLIHAFGQAVQNWVTVEITARLPQWQNYLHSWFKTKLAPCQNISTQIRNLSCESSSQFWWISWNNTIIRHYIIQIGYKNILNKSDLSAIFHWH